MSAAAPLAHDALRAAFACFPSGVAAVCALADGVPVGMAVSSFTSVSLDPPLVSVCVQKSSATWPVLRTCPVLGISVLAEHQGHAGTSLARKTGDRFRGVHWRADERGAVVVENSAARFVTSIHREVEAGDHDLVLLAVESLESAVALPLVFHGSRFTRLALEAEDSER